MSTTTTSTTTDQGAATGGTGAPEGTQGPGTGSEVTEGGTGAATEGTGRPENREARYRTERNEARTERDALQTRLDTLQRGEVERLAAGHLAAGDAVWLGGADLAAMQGEDGNIDPAKVKATCEALGAARPYLLPNRPSAADIGLGGSGGEPPAKNATWGEALRGEAGESS